MCIKNCFFKEAVSRNLTKFKLWELPPNGAVGNIKISAQNIKKEQCKYKRRRGWTMTRQRIRRTAFAVFKNLFSLTVFHSSFLWFVTFDKLLWERNKAGH